MGTRGILAGMLWLAAGTAAAAPDEDAAALAALPEIGGAVVTAADDGMTLTLEGGKVVRLAGIEAPLPPLGRPLDADSALAAASRQALVTLAVGRTVMLRDPVDLDRYGRQVAQVVRADGVWLEAAMLDQGEARVATTLGHREMAAAMLDHEAMARGRGLGLWRSRLYAVEPPDRLVHASGSFEIVEGRVAAAEKRHGATWLDFGADALAARLDGHARKLFLAAALDPATLAGRRIRLRGWIRWEGRPVIELTHPEQVELIDEGD